MLYTENNTLLIDNAIPSAMMTAITDKGEEV